jgi:hypothetical protein
MVVAAWLAQPFCWLSRISSRKLAWKARESKKVDRLEALV